MIDTQGNDDDAETVRYDERTPQRSASAAKLLLSHNSDPKVDYSAPLVTAFAVSSGDRVTYEFKIGGMTCVNCSTAIERGLTSEFKNKGLAQENDGFAVNVVLLMHKMRITFHKELAEANMITPNVIVSEIEDIGFEAELIAEHAINNQVQQQE